MANKVTYVATNQLGESKHYVSLDDFYSYIGLDDSSKGLTIKAAADRRNEWIVFDHREEDNVLWTIKTVVVTVPDSPQEISELDE